MQTEPVEMLTADEARELAVLAHDGQVDRDGSLHIDHVARVADVAGSTEAFQRVAWLHDVIEDTDLDPERLRRRLPETEWQALCLLTHDDAVPYDDYIDTIIRADGDGGALARAVKESDLLDNLQRCCAARDGAVGRYGAALARLWDRPR
jgi:hypothetical protein